MNLVLNFRQPLCHASDHLFADGVCVRSVFALSPCCLVKHGGRNSHVCCLLVLILKFISLNGGHGWENISAEIPVPNLKPDSVLDNRWPFSAFFLFRPSFHLLVYRAVSISQLCFIIMLHILQCGDV